MFSTKLWIQNLLKEYKLTTFYPCTLVLEGFSCQDKKACATLVQSEFLSLYVSEITKIICAIYKRKKDENNQQYVKSLHGTHFSPYPDVMFFTGI